MTVLGGLGAALLGAALGAAYFAGLWWTVSRWQRWRRPALVLALSFVVRGALVLAAFLALAQAGFAPLALAFAGFLVARVALSFWLRPLRTAPPSGAPPAGAEANDAPRTAAPPGGGERRSDGGRVGGLA